MSEPQQPFAESQVLAKALEAMAKPVAASRVADLPEILGDGHRGRLLKPDNAAGLAGAFVDVAAHPGEAGRRAARGRLRFRKEASAIRSRLEPLLAGAAGRQVTRRG